MNTNPLNNNNGFNNNNNNNNNLNNQNNNLNNNLNARSSQRASDKTVSRDDKLRESPSLRPSRLLSPISSSQNSTEYISSNTNRTNSSDQDSLIISQSRKTVVVPSLQTNTKLRQSTTFNYGRRYSSLFPIKQLAIRHTTI